MVWVLLTSVYCTGPEFMLHEKKSVVREQMTKVRVEQKVFYGGFHDAVDNPRIQAGISNSRKTVRHFQGTLLRREPIP